MQSLPGKYAKLIAASDIVDVPRAELIPQAFFEEWLENYSDVRDAMLSTAILIEATAGAMLPEQCQTIAETLSRLRFRTGAIEALSRQVGTILERRQLCAVRSAAALEDSVKTSFAGVYLSQLDVQPKGDEILAAALDVWKSYFSIGALTARLQAKLLLQPINMNVICQVMVRSKISGVLFSKKPDGSAGMCLEFVQGLGEALVSGLSKGTYVDADRLEDVSDGHRMVCSQVFDAARRLFTLFGDSIDMEWSWDGERVWVLQVRDITTAVSRESSLTACWAVVDLFAEDASKVHALRPIPQFAEYIRQKRMPLFSFAKKHNVKIGVARIISFNELAISIPSNQLALLQEFATSEVVVDLSDAVRQQIVGKAELIDHLWSYVRGKGQEIKVLVREYRRGQIGLISRLSPTGEVICECCYGGLLELNRGLAGAVLLPLEGQQDGQSPISQQEAATLRRVTVAAQKELGSFQLEWVKEDDVLYLVDLSNVASEVVGWSNGEDGSTLSPGLSAGPVLIVESSDTLVKLSIGPSVNLNGIVDVESMTRGMGTLIQQARESDAPPIIVARRPYAALAALIPYAGGFLFEEGSMLCHLSILLRESAKPAVSSKRLYENALGETYFEVDAQP